MDEIKVIDRTESVSESVFKDIVTFSFLIFCIWISQGSTWWTFFTGTITLLALWSRLASAFKQRVHTFKTKTELIEWANSLDWPDKN